MEFPSYDYSISITVKIHRFFKTKKLNQLMIPILSNYLLDPIFSKQFLFLAAAILRKSTSTRVEPSVYLLKDGEFELKFQKVRSKCSFLLKFSVDGEEGQEEYLKDFNYQNGAACSIVDVAGMQSILSRFATDDPQTVSITALRRFPSL